MLAEDSKRGWTSGSDNDAVERARKRRKGKEKQVVVVSDESEAVERGDAQQLPADQDLLQDGDDGGEESAVDSDDDIAWEDVDLSAKRPLCLPTEFIQV
jgi:hypothetical protein